MTTLWLVLLALQKLQEFGGHQILVLSSNNNELRIGQIVERPEPASGEQRLVVCANSSFH